MFHRVHIREMGVKLVKAIFNLYFILMPASYFSSITILTANSGLADALSTALFSMSYEDGLALVERIGAVEVLWISSAVGMCYR